VKYATHEIEGDLLDAAVAVAEGLPFKSRRVGEEFILLGIVVGDGEVKRFRPSTNWSDGGPIIERERISLLVWAGNMKWVAHTSPRQRNDRIAYTPLIAAMRTFVASKIGNEVDLP